MKPKLIILIPTITGREDHLARLLNILVPQVDATKGKAAYLVYLDNREKTIGEKRNILMDMAANSGATHRAFVDDDDTISSDYIKLNMVGVKKGFDCNSLVGIYSENGKVLNKPDGSPKYFLHSIKYDRAWDDTEYFYRPPNHLNVTKISLIKDIQYEHKNFGEDMCHAMEVFNTGRLKTEHQIIKPIYNYLFRTKIDGI